MKKVSIITLMLYLTMLMMAVTYVQGIEFGPKAVDKWFEEKLPHAKEKLTKLHFYFHDNLSGKNQTAFVVAQANTTSTSPTLFGLVAVIDDPLTVSPDPNSKIIGRAQGMYASASLEENLGLLLTVNYVFTEGKYNGSTLTVLGTDPIFHKYREMPILGGTGVFRLARGIATAQTYISNNTSGNAIVEYHVEVLHYE